MPVYTVRRSDPITVCSACPERAYLQLRLPETVSEVTKVTFRTLSHDQGFSHEEDRHRGSYNYCNSYFEAALVNASSRERLPRRILQYNRHAVFEPFSHENVWNGDGSDLDTRGWLKAIRAGDAIQVVPMARFCAWRNFVLSAEIIVECDEVSDAALISPLSARVFSGLSQAGLSIYRPLDSSKSEIRLIRLLPGLYHDDLVQCRLIYVRLAEAESLAYDCLSYNWGDVHDTVNLRVEVPSGDEDDEDEISLQKLPITRSLYNALRRLRHQNDQDRVLWVDAICINQGDMIERGEQVARMRQIYARASVVVIWIGESSEETHELFEAALAIGKTSSHGQAAQLCGLTFNDRLENFHSPLQKISTDWKALDIHELGREWFRRTWVIQEVLHARSTVLQCGEKVVPWSLMLRLNLCMHRPSTWSSPWRRTVIPDVWRELFDDQRCTKDPLGLSPMNPPPMDVLDVLLHGIDLEATDPRDKIFSLLGFLEDKDFPPEVRPDYTKSTAAVFADFTRWWIETRRSLRILSAIHVNYGRTWQNMSAFPPENWEGSRPSWSLWYDGTSSWAKATLAAWGSWEYNASAGLEARVVRSTPHVLVLEGYTLGQIESIEAFPYFSEDTSLNTLRDVYTQLLEPTNARNIWTSSSFQPGKHDASGKLELANDILYDHVYTHRFDNEPTKGIFRCHHANFLKTSEGLQGLCPPGAHVGDIIAILPGGLVPYILRRLQPSDSLGMNGEVLYHFIGESFIEGYMQGRAIKEQRDPEVFALV